LDTMNQAVPTNNDADLLTTIHVRIIPFDTGDPGNRVRAYVELNLGDCILLRGIRIIETQHGGLFISYPSSRKADGSYRDLVLVRDKTFANRLRKRILDAYHSLGSPE
jgi:stage V sporulation protein G